MARGTWRTVSCETDSRRDFKSQQAAKDWVGGQPAGARFRIQVDAGHNWVPFTTVVSNGDGPTEEEM
jgi:hypothetical protein